MRTSTVTTYAEASTAIDDLTKSALAIKAERDRFRVALEFIAAHEGKTLLNLDLGEDGNRAYQLGAYAAFNQAAGFAIAALNIQQRENSNG